MPGSLSGRAVQEMPAVGQEVKDAMARFAPRGIERRHRAATGRRCRRRHGSGPFERGTKRMVPSGPHAPRLTLYESASTVTGPPAASTFFSLPPAKNAIASAVGRPEREGRALGVGKRRDARRRAYRTHSARRPSDRAENASRCPSGDTTGQSGQSNPKAVGQRDVEARPRLRTFGPRRPEQQRDTGGQPRRAALRRARTARRGTDAGRRLGR